LSSGDESTTRRTTARTAPAKRAAAAAKKTATKPAAKKAVKVTAAKPSVAKRTATKAAPAKAAPAKKTTPTKAAAAKATPAKSALAKKATSKAAPAKKTTAKAAPAKAAAKKTAAKAAPAKKTAAPSKAETKVSKATAPRKAAAPAATPTPASAPTPTLAARVASSPTESGAAAQRQHQGQRWQSRPYAGAAVRLVALAVPIAASVGSAVVFSKLLHRPDGGKVVLWWLAIVAASTLVLAGVDRIARRLLPLATLLKLSMAFPDQAPSRFSVAARAGTTRGLREKLARAQEEGVEDEPAQAAERILTLVGALGAHDRRTRGHSERVRAFNDLIAEELRLPQHDRDRLRWAALLHDIGKLHVSPKLLNKPSKPTDKEWAILKSHPARGARIAAPLAPWLGEWAPTIEQHHERWDGAGYPNGVSGDDICLGARIVAVADAYEVMTAPRPYSRPVSASAARHELARCAGAQFDPEVVRAFLNVSIGSLRKVIGPISWLAQLPFLGATPRLEVVVGAAGRQVVTAAATATGTGMIAAAMLPHAAAPGHHHGHHRVQIEVAAQSSSGGSVAPGQTGTAPSTSANRPADTGPTAAAHRATSHDSTGRSHTAGRGTAAGGTATDTATDQGGSTTTSDRQRPAGQTGSSQQPNAGPTTGQPAPSTGGGGSGTGGSTVGGSGGNTGSTDNNSGGNAGGNSGGNSGGGSSTPPTDTGGGTDPGTPAPDDSGTGSTPPGDTGQQPDPTTGGDDGTSQDGDHNGDGHADEGKGKDDKDKDKDKGGDPHH
jgi:putative nucleotidyltransferase with HDIG domain